LVTFTSAVSCQQTQIDQIHIGSILDLIKERTSLNSLVGLGSKIEVDGLEETVVLLAQRDQLDRSHLNTNQVLKILLKLLYLMMYQ